MTQLAAIGLTARQRWCWIVVLLFAALSGALTGAAAALNGSAAAVSLEQILRPVELVRPVATEGVGAGGRAAETAPVRLTLERILRELELDLAAGLAAGDQVELSSNAQWKPLLLPGDAVWSVTTESPFRPDPRGNWFPLVVVTVNGEASGSWRLPLKVALYRSVWMSYARLARGEIPQAPAVRAVLRNVYHERGSPIPASEDISGYEVVQPVAEGRLLSWSDLSRRPLVRRGEMVEVAFEDGVLSVQMPALSMQDGILGDRIVVRNTRSRREFTGIVSGPGQVRIGTQGLP